MVALSMIARWIPELRTRLKFSVSFRPAFNECLRNRPTFAWHDFGSHFVHVELRTSERISDSPLI